MVKSVVVMLDLRWCTVVRFRYEVHMRVANPETPQPTPQRNSQIFNYTTLLENACSIGQ